MARKGRLEIDLKVLKLSGSNEGFCKIGVTQALFKEAGTADSATDLLIMSAIIGAIVPGSCLISHVGIGSKPYVLFVDFHNVTISLNWFKRST